MKDDPKPNPTIEDRMAEFDGRIIAHPILESVFENLRMVVHRPAGSSILANIGPTGAGKTTLVRRLYRDRLKETMPVMEANPSQLPVVLVEAPSPDNGAFHWGDFYVRFLEAALEPMVEKKTIDTFEREIRERRKKVGTFSELRRAVEHCIRYRGTQVVIIDEAQHLAKVPNARRLQDQLDTIKSLASLAGVLFVMVGTYELMTLLNQNGQLARRTRRVHFPRYHLECAADHQAFRNILGMFESRLPVDAHGVLVSNLEYLYEGSLGCIGILKDWLRRALARVVDAGGRALSFEDLRATILDSDSLLAILQEIRDGEARIGPTSKSDELRSQLRLGSAAPNSPEAPANQTNSKRGVGERKLVRDAVGIAL